MPKPDSKPTQDFVDIDYVHNGVLVLKNGGLRQILMVSGVNFELKSEEEQELTIGAFQSFINSLRFSVQIFIHSRKVNIDAYIARLQERLASEDNELLNNQIKEYIEFIKSFVGKNQIMNKNFFVIVPFEPLTLPGVSKGKGFLGLFGLGKNNAEASAASAEEKERHFRENSEQLNQRATQVMTELSQIGLRAVPLQDEEIMDLFYNLYNPKSVEKKEFSQSS